MDAHSEFAWEPKDEKSMLITWGAGAAPSSARVNASAEQICDEPDDSANASASAWVGGDAENPWFECC